MCCTCMPRPATLNGWVNRTILELEQHECFNMLRAGPQGKKASGVKVG